MHNILPSPIGDNQEMASFDLPKNLTSTTISANRRTKQINAYIANCDQTRGDDKLLVITENC